MTITKARNNKYGPATLDIQFENGADFHLELFLKKGTPLIPWNLLGATLEACFSNTWNPTGAVVSSFLVTILDIPTGYIKITLTKLEVQAITFSLSPAKLPSPIATGNPSRFIQLGGWTLKITQDGITKRIIDGDVQMDRDPCLQ